MENNGEGSKEDGFRGDFVLCSEVGAVLWDGFETNGIAVNISFRMRVVTGVDSERE